MASSPRKTPMVTEQTTTKETPFALVYGRVAVIPAEIGVPFDWVTYHLVEDAQESKLEALDNLEEKRESATIKQAAYNQIVAKYHNAKIKPRGLKPSDLVLRTVENDEVNQAYGKLNPNWEGPYRVTETLQGNAYMLETIEGKALPNAWNMAKLKFYF